MNSSRENIPLLAEEGNVSKFLNMTRYLTPAFILAMLLLMPARLPAHEIPSDIRVQVFVKPEGQRLRVLVRAPLKSIIETRPEAGPGLLDLSQADPKMREGAMARIANELAFFEGDRRLNAPQIASIIASNLAN